MTEKQYKLVIDEDTGAENILDVIGNKEYNLIEDIVDLLNEQVATIIELHYALNQRTEQCDKYYDENEWLKEEIKKLDTFKKILDFAEKDMEERADWQAYCEKEFEGL